MIMKLLMVLTGLILAQLGIITFMNSSHYIIGVLLLFGGVMSVLEGLPDYD
tara:strand:- start:894 stop:1046 length:153 start_codon:yes stop_codon:yes gene_type:complete